MNIVILDGYTLNPGDLNWAGFEALGSLRVYDRIPEDTKSIIDTIGNATLVITNKTPLRADVIRQIPHVKYIGVLATGYNVVDIAAATEMGILVTNVPGYGTTAVAQFTMALLLEICHHIGAHNQSVQAGDWVRCPDFCYWNHPLIELEGKTMGIIGYGNIGRATARMAQAFGMKVVYASRSAPTPETHTDGAVPRLNPEPKHATLDIPQPLPLDALFAVSDVISLHCPLTPETKHLICAESIAKMKKGVFILNTARGPLIHEQDLADALRTGRVGGAALDVVTEEPMKKEHVLLGVQNCIITPHIAWASLEARQRLMHIAVKNVEAFLNGQPQNVVNQGV